MAKILRSSIPYKGPVSENLIEFLQDGLERNAKQTIFIDSTNDHAWTGSEIQGVISRVSKFLIDECGLKKGDVCCLYGPTGETMVLMLLSAISAGATNVYLADAYKIREVVDVTNSTGAKFFISSRSLLESAQSALGQSDLKVISCDTACAGYKNGCIELGSLLSKDSTNPGYTFAELIQKTAIDCEIDFAIIQFSSGTTGKPKPIPRTHKNLCHLVASVDHEELMDLKPGEVITGSLALTHRPGLWALLACINGGGTFVLWTNLSDIIDALRVIEKYKVTIFSSSLPVLAMLGNTGVQNKDRFNTSSLRQIITSGSKIVHADLPKLLVKEFNLKSLRQCFGMTECGWVFLVETSLAKDNYLTVGHACPSMDVMIVDRETGNSVEGPNIKGEIILRGPQIFPGYLTGQKGVFNRGDFTESGWFKTGDQGYYDSSELIFIEGRYKELLVLRTNWRFFPNEIETIISEHPSVEGACVVKVSDGGEVTSYDKARAYVTLKDGCKLTEQELIDHINQLSHLIVLDGGVRFLDKFPRLENGKVNKQALKDMA